MLDSLAEKFLMRLPMSWRENAGIREVFSTWQSIC